MRDLAELVMRLAEDLQRSVQRAIYVLTEYRYTGRSITNPNSIILADINLQ